MVWENFSNIVLFLSEFTNGKKLQSKFGTKRTKSRVRSLETTIEPVRATFEREPSAI